MSEKIAVFIDGDNVSHNIISLIMNEIKNYGRIICCNVYADWSCENMKNWKLTANKLGIITVQCDRISGKNSTDIKMAVDVMKILYTIKHISLFYLVTSDSDYRHLVPEIKLLNKKVNCIGSIKSNNSLQSVCDVFTKIEVLKLDEGVTKNKNDQNQEEKAKHNPMKIKKKLKYQYLETINILFDQNDVINLSLIKDTLQRKLQFDYREFGYHSMGEFISKNFINELKIHRSYKGKPGLYVSIKEINDK